MLPIINSEVVYLEKIQQIGSIQLTGCSELEVFSCTQLLCIIFVCNSFEHYSEMLLILVWQKWTKYWTKVVIYGNFVHTNVTYQGITNHQKFVCRIDPGCLVAR